MAILETVCAVCGHPMLVLDLACYPPIRIYRCQGCGREVREEPQKIIREVR